MINLHSYILFLNSFISLYLNYSPNFNSHEGHQKNRTGKITASPKDVRRQKGKIIKKSPQYRFRQKCRYRLPINDRKKQVQIKNDLCPPVHWRSQTCRQRQKKTNLQKVISRRLNRCHFRCQSPNPSALTQIQGRWHHKIRRKSYLYL